eukprot:6045112-Pyramimonas_sp.AAC.1
MAEKIESPMVDAAGGAQGPRGDARLRGPRDAHLQRLLGQRTAVSHSRDESNKWSKQMSRRCAPCDKPLRRDDIL